MILRSLALAAMLVVTGGPTFAQTTVSAPRDTVAAIAGAIRDLYFSAERGDAIADALEAEAASGRYDALSDPRDLAGALSERLGPEDAHFNVTYDPNAPQGRPDAGPGPGPGPGPGAGPRPRPRPDGPDPIRFSNYGFTRVEILPGNIGLIEMRQFAHPDLSNPSDPARRAADAALAMVAETDAVIIDLRNNGGGSPEMVGYLASAFTPADAAIYNVFHSREGTISEAPSVYYLDPRLDVPVYILTSARTGSAAEAFPYTLQSAGRAVVVGETSGGAANPGGMVPIGGGFAVFISGGSPVNPITGSNWEGTGVIPNVDIPAAAALSHAQALALTTIAADPGRTDAQWALSALQPPPAAAIDLGDYVAGYGPFSVALEGDHLVVRRGRRPAMTLNPLGADLFYVASDPLVRFAFERDVTGGIIAVEQRNPFGPPLRQRRD